MHTRRLFRRVDLNLIGRAVHDPAILAFHVHHKTVAAAIYAADVNRKGSSVVRGISVARIGLPQKLHGYYNAGVCRSCYIDAVLMLNADAERTVDDIHNQLIGLASENRVRYVVEALAEGF